MHFLIASQWIGEQPITSNYFHKAIGLITDAPHATAEIFYSTIENVIILTFGFIWGKKSLKKQHDILDAEHGHKHQD
jgi:hypothetical protein